MKLKTLVAMIGLSLSASAFAVPLVANSSTPSVINAAPGGESSLQTIADGLYSPAGSIDVVNGQSSAGMFASTSPSAATTIPTLVAEFTGNSSTQIFGIWFGTDTSNIVNYDLMLGSAGVGAAAAISIGNGTLDVGSVPVIGCGTTINCGSFSNALINPNSFGFYFQASANSPRYYSLDQLNPNGQDRVVAFQNGASTNWLFAYEDGTDFDYNDMAVKVESITAAVPEPETYALMLAGLAAMGFVARRRKAS